jgi:hypothetical protein
MKKNVPSGTFFFINGSSAQPFSSHKIPDIKNPGAKAGVSVLPVWQNLSVIR